jgi:hypothetical protein
MKGVTFITDETNNKRYVQLDIKEVAKNPEMFEDLLDIIVAEARKNEKKIPLEDVKKKLKKAGKL